MMSQLTDCTAHRGIYKGRPLFKFSVDQWKRHMEIRPTAAVKRDFGKKPPCYITIRSLNATRLLPVLDAMTKTYTDTGDVVEAYLVAAEVADMVNESIASGEPPMTSCNCTEQMKKSELHPCGRCFNTTVCASRKLDGNSVPVCEACFERSKGNPTTFIRERVRHSLLYNSKNEAKKAGRDFTDKPNTDVFNETLEDLMRQIPESSDGMTYDDCYIGKLQSASATNGNEHLTQNVPELVSVEGIFPCIVRSDELRYHAKGNVFLTATAINRTKHAHLPADLAHLQWYLDGLPTEERQLELIRRCDESHEVTVLCAYRIATRLNQSVNIANVQLTEAEWLAGKPHESHKSRGMSFHKVDDRAAPDYEAWSEISRARLRKLVVEIAHTAGHTLVFGDDGCPWLGMKAAMPPGWSWRVCFRLCAERCRRLKYKCNRRWLSKTPTQIDSYSC